MKRKSPSLCPLCGGAKRPGSATFTAEPGFGVVVVRNVPASVCSQCGADWIADKISERLEAIVAEARTKHLQLEVTSLSGAAAGDKREMNSR